MYALNIGHSKHTFIAFAPLVASVSRANDGRASFARTGPRARRLSITSIDRSIDRSSDRATRGRHRSSHIIMATSTSTTTNRSVRVPRATSSNARAKAKAKATTRGAVVARGIPIHIEVRANGERFGNE